jgi:hypothetical protein
VEKVKKEGEEEELPNLLLKRRSYLIYLRRSYLIYYPHSI